MSASDDDQIARPAALIMHEKLINYVSGPTALRALDLDLRLSDDDPERRLQLLRRLAATLLSRPAALISACRAARLHERCPLLAKEVCLHALARATGDTERTAVLNFASQIGLVIPGVLPAPVPAPDGGYFTAAQRRALARLRAMASIFFDDPPTGPLAARLIPLIIGPSGAGKNHLIRAFAKAENCPVLRLTIGDWIVQGARRQCTIERLRDFITPLPRAIVHLDELDKFRLNNDPWSLSVFGEVFSVLDREVGITTDEKPWTTVHAEKLRRSVFILASGTWQDAWRSSHSVGFAGNPGTADASAEIRRSGLVPPELVNRFNDHWLLLEPYREADFQALVAELGLPPDLIDPAAAAASGLNYRYLENAYTEHLLAPGLTVPFPALHN